MISLTIFEILFEIFEVFSRFLRLFFNKVKKIYSGKMKTSKCRKGSRVISMLKLTTIVPKNELSIVFQNVLSKRKNNIKINRGIES